MALDILERLITEAQRLAPEFRGIRWYIFGSWARGEAEFNDIDVLIIYGDGIDSQRIREQLRNLCVSLPVDLYLFHEEEEAEFDFVKSEGCRCIFPPSTE